MSNIKILQGDCREQLATLPDESVHSCVTSPPYWNLRDYGKSAQIGLEKTPEEYVAEMVSVFREVRRVLRKDGTLWLNLGDSYAHNERSGRHMRRGATSRLSDSADHAHFTGQRTIPNGLKSKDLVGIPWRVAFALQADGWYLRQDIIWSKPNAMPESVKDRCTKSHEYIFLLSKSERYFFDHVAIMEKALSEGKKCGSKNAPTRNESLRVGMVRGNGTTRNRRTVWQVATRPYKGAHFAAFPSALIEPCILAGCPQRCCCNCGKPYLRIVDKESICGSSRGSCDSDYRARTPQQSRVYAVTNTIDIVKDCDCNELNFTAGVVLDPFSGAGTTLVTARELGRNSIGIELNEEYIKLAEERLNCESPAVKKKEQHRDIPREEKQDSKKTSTQLKLF